MENLSLMFGSGWLSEFALLSHWDRFGLVSIPFVDGCHFSLLTHDLPALEVDSGGECIGFLLFLQFPLLLFSGFLLSLLLPLRQLVLYPLPLSLPLIISPFLLLDYEFSLVLLFHLTPILQLSEWHLILLRVWFGWQFGVARAVTGWGWGKGKWAIERNSSGALGLGFKGVGGSWVFFQEER